MEPAINAIGVLIAIVLIYFAPWLVAWSRQHRQINAIAALNIFLGWTFVGWVAALVWSLTDDRKERVA